MTQAKPTSTSSTGDMLFGMGGRLLYAATRVALPPLALAHMGLGDYGLWAACFVLVGYIGMAASGFTLVYLRTTAQYHAKGDTGAIGRLLSTGMLSMGALALALLAGLWLAMPWLLNLFNVAPEQRPLATDLWLGTLAVFLADMSIGAFANVLHAIGRLRQEQRVWVVAFLLEAALIVLFLQLGWGVRGLLAAFAGRYLFSASANAVLACRALPGLRLSPRLFDRSLLKSFFGYGAGMQASGLIAAALQSADRLLAGALIGPQATALMDLAGKLPSTTAAVTSSAAVVAQSASARHDAHGQSGALRGVYLDATRVTVASLALTMPFLAWFAQPLTLAWLGQGEAQATVAPLMAMLSVGLHLHMLTAPATSVARGRGQLGADFIYHGLRVVALAAVVGLWLRFGAAQTVSFALALSIGQVAAACVFLAGAHRLILGSWAGIGSRLLLPTAAAYALGGALRALLPLHDAAGRGQALLTLAGLALLWGLAAIAVLGPLLTTPEERRALLQRLARPLAWRRA